MFAVVSIAGFQEIVREGDTLNVPLQDAEKGKTITFDSVLLVSPSEGQVTLGKPYVSGASVEAAVVDHGRDDKINVVKFRRRKRYTRTKGHRQHFTTITIKKIVAGK